MSADVSMTPDTFAAFESWLGTPLPENPVEAMRILRRQAEQEIERLLAFLDATDGDTDMEPELAGTDAYHDGGEDEDTDAEPSLGWPLHGPSALDKSHAHDLDAELDESDAEPSLASPESATCPDRPKQSCAFVSIPHSQTSWARGNSADLEGDPKEDDEDSHDAEDDKSDYEPDCDDEAYLAGATSETEGTDAKPSPKYAKALRARRARSRRKPGWRPGPDGLGNVDMTNAMPVVNGWPVRAHPLEGQPVTLVDPAGLMMRIDPTTGRILR
jgi:hypothetical protein